MLWRRGQKYVGLTGVSFKTKFNQHKYSMINNKGPQTGLSKFYNKNSNIDIRWSIPYKVRENVLNKSDNYSIYNLESMAITKSNEDISLYIRNELVTVCPHFKSNYVKKKTFSHI